MSDDELIAQLRERISYDPDSGLLTWNDGIRAGCEPGRLCDDGYRRVSFPGRKSALYAHRIAFALTYGRWPAQIDHINGRKDDNRLANLREATSRQNQCNRAANRNCKSGYKGVTMNKGRWRANLKKDGVVIYLGTFGTPEEARDAYKAAAIKYQGHFAFSG